jgi:hypothetical protein
LLSREGEPRWLLLKREVNLKEEQRFRLRDLVRYKLKTVRAYLLKEAFLHRAYEEDRSLPAAAPGTDSQLFPGAEAGFQRSHGGSE